MQKIFLLSLFLGISISLFSQRPMGNGNGQMPTGTIYGKIIDSASGNPLDAVSVQLLQTKRDSATQTAKDVVVAGGLTNSKGEFNINNIPAMGMYKLLISGIGYKPYNRNFSFIDRGAPAQGNMMGALDKDLGNIRLAIDNQLLQGVTVTGSRPAVQLGIDRKIYNVENNSIAAGGSATDVLKTVPSVSVDIDGNVSVRNSSPQIFVDGRPTTLTLDQIPADQIETVEVITNPSAKYDASGGTAGILNIVLKKTRRVGYSGNVRAGIDQRGKVNLGGNFNVRQGKINFFANGMYNQRKSMGSGETERTSRIADSIFKMTQTDKNINEGAFMFGRAGFDYFIDNRNTITISGLLMGGNFDNSANSTIVSDTTATGYSAQSTTLRETLREFQMRNTGGSLAYVHNFPKNGHQFTADVNYFNGKNDNESNIVNNSGGNHTFRQLQEGKGNNERVTAQIDYANPLSDKSKFETGVRLNQMKLFNENNLSFVTAAGPQIQLPLSSKFNYTDRVWAGYVNFSSKIGENFGYQVGLRAESSQYDGQVTSYDNNNVAITNPVSINYPISLFPSVFLSQQLKNDQSLQLNYSRRINRPGFFQLFPFIMDYSDSLNISRGNAELRPEFTNSFELSYSKNFDRLNNLILSVYYKNTNDLITRYQTKEQNPINGEDVIVSTYINANSGMVSGFEAVSKNKITNWWDVTSNLNIYTSKINTSDLPITTVGQIWSWFGKLNSDFKLPKNFTVQLSGEYTSKRVLSPGGSNSGGGGGGMGRGPMGGGVSGSAQGYTMPNLDVDGSIKYEFLKNKAASVTLSVRDIFRTDINEVYTFTPYFDQHSIRRRDQQFFRLSFAYRFGKFDQSLFKRKNMRNEQEGMQNGMEGMGQ
ncbi:MAG: TonB-dependent receptor [Niabella sp. SCN 42-15]|nr:MAG: TonB-dependent receptor [Niabella sp. SCN 42-15]